MASLSAITDTSAGSGSPARLRGRTLTLAHGAWLLCAGLSLALFVASLPTYYTRQLAYQGDHQHAPAAVHAGLEQLGISPTLYVQIGLVPLILVVAVFVAVGAIIFWRKRDNPAMLYISLTLVVFGAIWPNTMDDLASAHPLLTEPERLVNAIGFGGFFALCYLFPDGRFVPRWSRWVCLGWAAFEVFTLWPLPAPPNFGPAQPLVVALLVLLFPGTMLYAQIHRYRRESTPTQRQQLKWVSFALVLVLVSFVLTGLAGELPVVNRPGVPAALYDVASDFVYTFVFMLVPVAIGLAVLRHRLWDIDPIINHTLVYGGLTTAVVALYVLVVAELGVIFGTGGNLLFSLIATGLVAVIFQPLRLHLQRGANRLVYGERDDPYRVLSRLGQRLDSTLAPEALLPAVVQTVCEALRLPYAAVALRQGEDYVPAAAAGSPVPGLLCLPLVYQQEPVGQLWLAPRAPGEQFSVDDWRLLDDLARQISAAAQAVHLARSLQRSREQLVTAREEERRRLRRDLHDGLGPRLASLTMRLETARGQLGADPAADALLADLALRAQEAVADIRRLVYQLRPPALDELGLVSALHETALLAGVPLAVEAPEPLPPLPAAVEVAAFRIGQEALTNTARYAGAGSCRLRLALGPVDSIASLTLEVADDGRGIAPEKRLGVGLLSMRERAEELGGRLTIESGPGGTTVRAVLPCAVGRVPNEGV
ncbi:MAG TPA: histidine kinase [Thermomicrobiaceae bacterium]|nr:histidine kinase [Thermomicrobiaceae bacterium]